MVTWTIRNDSEKHILGGKTRTDAAGRRRLTLGIETGQQPVHQLLVRQGRMMPGQDMTVLALSGPHVGPHAQCPDFSTDEGLLQAQGSRNNVHVHDVKPVHGRRRRKRHTIEARILRGYDGILLDGRGLLLDIQVHHLGTYRRGATGISGGVMLLPVVSQL
ncbi:hypothetical protein M3M50_07945 [Pseudomonas bijieensis]|uniref:hypothetical protein n=1 Tax=Pseudomonas bijieensis TaxID=2681983 RepID=UPI001E297AB9|nr:hypothetical protein [Pseudomonas bijieensis]MCD9115834.1 hypothetical protein [Pseudomonas bijieensis]UQI32543.1 hypothetical protein M3M50_07945 [Pseudomonas bijieensis]